MSKREVLEQVYPGEIEYIFDKKREHELKRYIGYMNQIMAASSAFGGGDASKEYIENVKTYIKELSSNESKEKTNNINDWYREYETLKNKDNLDPKDKKRIVELKEKMDDHINKEINKLKGIKNRQKQINDKK
jgi:hypothetical protein